MGEVLRMWSRFENGLALPLVSTIAPHAGLVAVKNIVDHTAIMPIGRGRRHRVDNLRFAVHADMRLQAKIPLIAFLGLMHLRIPLAIFVLGRGRSCDDRRVHDAARANLDTLGGKMCVNGLKQHLSQTVGFNQVTEFANRRLIRRWLATQINIDKGAIAPLSYSEAATPGSDRLNQTCRK